MLMVELTDAQMELLSGGYEYECYDENPLPNDFYQKFTKDDTVSES